MRRGMLVFEALAISWTWTKPNFAILSCAYGTIGHTCAALNPTTRTWHHRRWAIQRFILKRLWLLGLHKYLTHLGAPLVLTDTWLCGPNGAFERLWLVGWCRIFPLRGCDWLERVGVQICRIALANRAGGFGKNASLIKRGRGEVRIKVA
jgi:hypothetical protein